MFNNILVPLSRSSNSAKIVAWCERMAEPYNSTITLLRVVDSVAQFDIDKPHSKTDHQSEIQTSVNDQRISSQVSEFTAFLESVAVQIDAKRFNVKSEVIEGSVATAISKYARMHGAKLVIMSTGSVIDESELPRNTVTYEVLRNIDVPTLILHSDRSASQDLDDPKTIMVPLDGSVHSESVIPFAIALAGRYGAKVMFVLVTDPDSQRLGTFSNKFRSSSGAFLNIRNSAKAYLNTFVELAREGGVSASVSNPAGDVSSTLVSNANDLRDSMVVIGSRGMGGSGRLVLGSAAEKVVRGTSRPVLVIPPTDQV